MRKLPIGASLSVLALLFVPAPALAQDQPAQISTRTSEPVWAFETSDIPVDSAYRFGQLANGMRYIIRQNNRPEGTAMVRLVVGSGSLSETDSERGLAHFLEHMAFNGSKRVPEGEMIKLLEREGLAFGADTNASTGFDATTYKLDLPRNDPALLDTVLMILRETASELTIAPEAVDRERGVILAERRDRRNYRQADLEDRLEFLTPGARYTQRLPIGTEDVLTAATADDLRGYYEREYVPANSVLVVVGDFDGAATKAAIEKHFASWAAAPAPSEPETGPVDLDRMGLTDIYIDPALSERVTIARHAAWKDMPDTASNRQQNLLTSVGYGIVNRRLQALARKEPAPFRGAGLGTGDIFEDGRTTSIVIDSADGEWAKGLAQAVATVRQALTYGFTDAEVAEQIAGTLTAQQNAVSAVNTRSNGALISDALGLVEDDVIPSTPRSGLERLERFIPYITPAVVLAALQADAARLDNPLIRFQGRTAPAGGTAELRAAWDAAAAAPVEPLAAATTAEFAYKDFGTPGAVIADKVDPRMGIREIRFANGVRLNLKRTDLQEDRIAFEMNLDGGSLMNTPEKPLATALVSNLPAGGLGAHSQDELQSILAGRSVGLSFSSDADSFRSSGTTTPRDLELQMQLLTAAITDPGYRPEAEARYRRNIGNFFKSKDATPGSALGNGLGEILSDGDPRFTLQSEAAYKALDFAALRATIGDRLAKGAIELALVGDIDEQAAIDLVTSTFGALPQRELEFLPREDSRQRVFTADRTPRVLSHTGEANQALLRLTWPIPDDRDAAEVMRLEVLERVVRLALQEELRERLGKAYSPSASSSPSPTYRNYGTFSINASVDVGDVGATREAVNAALAALRSEGVDEDTLERARRPLLENYDNALKTNNGWMGLVDQAQSDSERIDRFLATRTLLEAVTSDDVRSAAARYLTTDGLLEVLVLPRQETAEKAVAAPL